MGNDMNRGFRAPEKKISPYQSGQSAQVDKSRKSLLFIIFIWQWYALSSYLVKDDALVSFFHICFKFESPPGLVNFFLHYPLNRR